MATDQINCLHTDNNVMYILLSYLCYHSKLCCQQKLSCLRIKHCFHKRRRQQHLYFKRHAYSQRLRKAYHHWLLRNSRTTVNKVRGIDREGNVRELLEAKIPNETLLLWLKKAYKNDILLYTRFLEHCSTVQQQGVLLIRGRYSQSRIPFRSRK